MIDTIVTSSKPAIGLTIIGFDHDAVAMVGDNCEVKNCMIIDSKSNDKAHRDMIQPRQTGSNFNAQMMGAVALNLVIEGNGLMSPDKAQGVFASDGGFYNIRVLNNIIDTQSYHKITLSGVMSGQFENNVDMKGSPVNVILTRMRIGGGLPQHFYVNTFKSYKYEPVICDHNLTDQRFETINGVYDFDLDAWQKLAGETEHLHGEFEKHFLDVKKKYEDIIGFNKEPQMTLKDEIIDEIIRVEGGYVNDPSDSGGETNFGITLATARAYGYTGEMINLPRDKAVDIYTRQYWDKLSLGEVYKVTNSESLVREIADTAVNLGISRASKFLQRSLNVSNYNNLFEDLVLDGDIGYSTINALRDFCTFRGLADGSETLVKMIDSLQGAFYIELAERRPKDERFVYGWFKNRVR